MQYSSAFLHKQSLLSYVTRTFMMLAWMAVLINTDAILENYGGEGYMVFDHNTIVSKGNTNGLGLQGQGYSNVTVTNNYFSGFGITVNLCGNFSGCSNIIFTDNIFGTDIKPNWRPLFAWIDGNGNLWRRNSMARSTRWIRRQHGKRR